MILFMLTTFTTKTLQHLQPFLTLNSFLEYSFESIYKLKYFGIRKFTECLFVGFKVMSIR